MGRRERRRTRRGAGDYWYRRASESESATEAIRRGDVEEARRYFLEAVDAGNANAATELAELAREAGDEGEAKRWFREAAELGSVEAAVVLGDLYSDGDDERDWSEAARWYRRAAETEEAGWCAYRLFELYGGDGDEDATLAKDDAEALRWLRRAAERTSDLVGPKAKLRLGEVCERGEFGVEPNVEEARRLYREALATLDELAERDETTFDDFDEPLEKLLNFATTDVETELRAALERAARRTER